MPDSIANAAVALSLVREALELLDAPEHAKVAVYLQRAINDLTQPRPDDPSLGVGDADKC